MISPANLRSEEALFISIRFAAAVLLISAASMPSMAVADATSDAKKAIQAAYDKADAAGARKDLEGSTVYYTPDFVYTGEDGKSFQLAFIKAQMKRYFQAAKSVQSKSTITGLKLKGNSATVTVHEVGHFVLANPQKPDQTRKLDVEANAEDLWVKTAKGWQVKKSKAISTKQWVDGKPFMPPKQ